MASMEIIREHVCKICLSSLPEGKCTALENVKKDMLDVVIPDLEFNTICEYPVICEECSRTLHTVYAFKSIALEREDELHNYVNPDSNKISLQEVYFKRLNENIGNINSRICRICFEVAGQKTHNIQEDLFLKDMVEKCLPELDLTLTEQPVSCARCLDLLQVQFKFIGQALSSEEKISCCCTICGINTSGRQKISLDSLSEMLKVKNLRTIRHLNGTDIDGIIQDNVDVLKFEIKSEQCDTEENCNEAAQGPMENDLLAPKLDISIVKTEEDLTPEEIEIKAENDSSLPTANTKLIESVTNLCDSKKTVIKCNICNFKTIKKLVFKEHMNTHIFKTSCDKCKYESEDSNQMYRHVYTAHTNWSFRYTCKLCNLQMDSQRQLRVHLKVVHKKKPMAISKNEHNIVIYKCKKCTFQTECNSSMDSHIQTHVLKTNQCPHEYCFYETKDLSNLRKHILTHKNTKNVLYNCQKCSYKTVNKFCFRIHERSHPS